MKVNVKLVLSLYARRRYMVEVEISLQLFLILALDVGENYPHK
jgi:hypothetical protein